LILDLTNGRGSDYSFHRQRNLSIRVGRVGRTPALFLCQKQKACCSAWPQSNKPFTPDDGATASPSGFKVLFHSRATGNPSERVALSAGLWLNTWDKAPRLKRVVINQTEAALTFDRVSVASVFGV
jgi:hypothetical protein